MFVFLFLVVLVVSGLLLEGCLRVAVFLLFFFDFLWDFDLGLLWHCD